jgi:aldehyde dehydrogenase (NAD+)
MNALDVLRAAGLSGHPRLIFSQVSDDDSMIIVSENPATGALIAGVRLDDEASYERAASASAKAFLAWRCVPAPVRGHLVRDLARELEIRKDAIGALISLEVGKILPEGMGEVQETIDIAEFAVGLSRQLYGMTMPSERPHHRIVEQWHPLGPVGVITAFNFPHAVWGWNAMIGAACGDSILWKPSLLAPLTAIATHEIAHRIATSHGHPDLFTLVIGRDDVVGERLVADTRFPLISATGSCRMGRRVGQVVAGRLGRSLLELGGNNAAILSQSANLDLAIRAIVFAAVGTAGQRCTTTRRLIVHSSIADGVCERLVSAYRSLRLGDPLAHGTLVGPLINASAVSSFESALARATGEGGRVLIGGKRASVSGLNGHFVEPTIVRVPRGQELPIAREETFAPILYVFEYERIEDAIAMNNAVPQGLSSAIFTGDQREAEMFTSATGSDCGLANVNAGTSGAEIGGAFGGEKETGGGRESGSDAWKAYMRRSTSTINHGREFALAQGIRFE